MGTKKKRRSFTPEYKAEVVRLVAAGDRKRGAGTAAASLQRSERGSILSASA